MPEKPVKAASPGEVIPNWRPVAVAAGGLAYFAGKAARPGFSFWALRIDLDEPSLRVVVKGGGGSAENILSTRVSAFVRDNGLLAGINALPFNPVSGREGEERTNVGIVVSGGVMVSSPHPPYDALVFYDDGGTAIVSQAELVSAENIASAAGGFYQILKDRELTRRTAQTKKRHPRSAAGLSADSENGRFLYLAVIDGRRPGSIGATEAETALLLKALGAADGINLDGGGSSALVLRYPGGSLRAVNTPIHGGIPGRERAVAGCIGIALK